MLSLSEATILKLKFVLCRALLLQTIQCIVNITIIALRLKLLHHITLIIHVIYMESIIIHAIKLLTQ